MKLRNKKTGAIYKIEDIDLGNNADGIWLGLTKYNSLAELNEEWEDYEEPKASMHVTGPVEKDDNTVLIEFYTHEEAKKAVEKLKAWKRLKDKGFRFEGIKEDYTRILQSQDPFRIGKRYLQFNKSEDERWMKENWQDLDLLFSGEDE